MYCNNCGNQLTDNAKFCNQCGAQIGVVKVAVSESTQSLLKPEKKIPVWHLITGIAFAFILTFFPLYRYYYTMGWDKSRDYYVGVFDMPAYNGLATFFIASWVIILACIVGYILFGMFNKNVLSMICVILILLILFIADRKLHENQFVLSYSDNFSVANMHVSNSNHSMALACVYIVMCGVLIGHILTDVLTSIIVKRELKKRAKKQNK